MTKCVVFIETAVRGRGTQRSYVNESGSLGMSTNWYDHQDHVTPLYSLDSRCLIFPTPKAAETFALALLKTHSGMAIIEGRDKIGYHGITENNNAQPPFKVVNFNGAIDVDTKIKKISNHRKLWHAYSEMEFIPPIQVANVSVGRDASFDADEMWGEIRYLTENMVEEELVTVASNLESIQRTGWNCTGFDKAHDSAVLHFTKTAQNGEPQHMSALIVAFNLTTGVANE